jgi:DNA-binding NarL/FixJ family response regulator
MEKDIRLVAFISSFIDPSALGKYDEAISILDDLDTLTLKISRLQNIKPTGEEESDSTESLSLREKEIVVCIVKGMTNKEIAEKLFLSIHTVITHRRNISKKLQIHSTAGLTIYAIVNKLIELRDIEDRRK